MGLSTLSDTELGKLKVLLESVDEGKCIVYGRVMISGTLYSSTMYKRSDVTNDSIVSLCTRGGSLIIGTVQKYVSCCRLGCTCNEDVYCGHFVVVDLHPTNEFGIVDSITNATAPQLKQILKPK